jgi:hypothetical protein
MEPNLTICTVNYKSSKLLFHLIKILRTLTENEWEMIIIENSQSRNEQKKLLKFTNKYPNIRVFYSFTQSIGSLAHAEALDKAVSFVKTPYFTIIDPDCFPLVYAWDRILIEKIKDSVKVCGTPLAMNTPSIELGVRYKELDFPLVFLMMFETKTFFDLNLSFLPGKKRGQDVGWMLRERYHQNNLTGFTLTGKNTRKYKGGHFRDIICDEYYLDAECLNLFCSHLGRGSAPSSDKYVKNKYLRFFGINILLHYFIMKKWLQLCQKLIIK